MLCIGFQPEYVHPSVPQQLSVGWEPVLRYLPEVVTKRLGGTRQCVQPVCLSKRAAASQLSYMSSLPPPLLHKCLQAVLPWDGGQQVNAAGLPLSVPLLASLLMSGSAACRIPAYRCLAVKLRFVWRAPGALSLSPPLQPWCMQLRVCGNADGLYCFRGP